MRWCQVNLHVHWDALRHCQHVCLQGQHPTCSHMAVMKKQGAEQSTRGFDTDQDIHQGNLMVSNLLGAASQGHLECQPPRQISWQCGLSQMCKIDGCYYWIDLSAFLRHTAIEQSSNLVWVKAMDVWEKECYAPFNLYQVRFMFSILPYQNS